MRQLKEFGQKEKAFRQAIKQALYSFRADSGDEENEKQKSAFRNIIRFFSIMLILTLIAKGTSGVTVPAVTTVTAAQGEIVKEFTAAGIIRTVKKESISVPADLTIEEILIHSGEEVKAGDGILKFSLPEIKGRLEEEKIKLLSLKANYSALQQKAVTDTMLITNARTILERTIEDSDSQKDQGKVTMDRAQGKYNEEGKTQDSLSVNEAKEILNRANSDKTDINKQGELAINRAQKKYNTALSQLSQAKQEWENIKTDSLSALEKRNLEVAKGTVNDANNAYYKALNEWNSAQTNLYYAKQQESQKVYDATQSLEKAKKQASDASDRLAQLLTDQKASEEELSAAGILCDSTSAALKNAQDNLNAIQTKYSNLTDTAQSRSDTALSSYNTAVAAKSAAEAALTTLQIQLGESGTQKIEAAEAAYKAAEISADNALEVLEDAKETARKELIGADRSIEDATDNVLKATLTNETEKEADREALEDTKIDLNKKQLDSKRSIEDARNSLDQAIQTKNQETEKNQADLKMLELNMKEENGTIAALSKLYKAKGILKAEKKGKIQDLNLNTGEKSKEDSKLSFLPDKAGYQVIAGITEKEQIAMVQNIKEVTVTADNGKSLTLPVAYITEADEKGEVQVAADIPEDFTVKDGLSLTVKFEADRNSYKNVLPISTVHHDSTGDYILYVNAKNTVLGVQNVLVRVPITILDKNQNSVAVEAPLSPDQLIVLTSTKPVSENDRVRLVDE